MSDALLSKLPPLPPGLDEEDCWFCYEYRASNEDFISPWFDEEFAIFEYLESLDDFLITRKYIRSGDGIREDNGLGDYHSLPVDNLDVLYESSGLTSLEDEVVS